MRLGMKHVLVSFSLALVAVFAPNTPYRVDDAMRLPQRSIVCQRRKPTISARSMRWS